MDYGTINCQETGCFAAFPTIPKLKKHLETEHSMVFEDINATFNSEQEFRDWMEQIELKYNSHYIRSSGEKKHGNYWVRYWQCHRSVNTLPKNQRSNKKNTEPPVRKFCTSGVVAKRYENGQVAVHICVSHYGHPHEVETLKRRKVKRFRSSLNIHEEVAQGVKNILFCESNGEITDESSWTLMANAGGDGETSKQDEASAANKSKKMKINVQEGKKSAAKKKNPNVVAGENTNKRFELRKQRESTKTLLNQIGNLVDMVDDGNTLTQSRTLLIQVWRILAQNKMSTMKSFNKPSNKKPASNPTATATVSAQPAKTQNRQIAIKPAPPVASVATDETPQAESAEMIQPFVAGSGTNIVQINKQNADGDIVPTYYQLIGNKAIPLTIAEDGTIQTAEITDSELDPEIQNVLECIDGHVAPEEDAQKDQFISPLVAPDGTAVFVELISQGVDHNYCS